MTKLTLADIADLREYEHGRDEFRASVIALKHKRRIGVGPIVTLVFENRETIRFQVQEMARAERIATDQGIQAELDTYNPLIPEPGHLVATLFVELTSEAQLREWLPKLVGVERHVALRLGTGPDAPVVRCTVDADHDERLTREAVTAAVHYVHFALTPAQIARFRTTSVALVIDHPAYSHEALLQGDNIDELGADLAG